MLVLLMAISCMPLSFAEQTGNKAQEQTTATVEAVAEATQLTHDAKAQKGDVAFDREVVVPMLMNNKQELYIIESNNSDSIVSSSLLEGTLPNDMTTTTKEEGILLEGTPLDEGDFVLYWQVEFREAGTLTYKVTLRVIDYRIDYTIYEVFELGKKTERNFQ